MKRLLLITYDFPPRGASGVFRMAKFARYLPEWDWQPVVVTAAGVGPHPDPQLLTELPSNTEILRVGLTRSHDAQPAAVLSVQPRRSWRSRLKPWIVPDPQLQWVPAATWLAWRRLRAGDIQLIMTSGPPFSTHLVGLALKQFAPRVPWLMDLRDPWSEAPNQRLLIPYKLNRLIERRCLQSADHVTVVTDGMQQLMIERLGVAPERITTITNGFDRHDTAPTGTSRTATAQCKPGPLCIRYVGSIVGLRAQAAQGFFSALQQLQAEGIDRSRLLVQFIGTFAPAIHTAASHVPELVDIVPFVSHAEAVDQMATADVLLLLLTNDMEGRIMHTSKLFEYLALGRPILNIAPPGEVRDLIASTGAGSSVRPTDVDDIAGALRSLIERHAAGQLAGTLVDPARLKRFERRELAGQLAQLLNRLTGVVVDAGA